MSHIKRTDFYIIPYKGGHILCRHGKPDTWHTHIKNMSTCNMLIKMICQNKLPNSPYLVDSCKKLLTEQEFNNLRPPKDRYYNVNKGGKRRRK